MTILFNTADGLIQVDQEKKFAYFLANDIEVPLNDDGTFQDLNGREYRVLWATTKIRVATLQVREWKILDYKVVK